MQATMPKRNWQVMWNKWENDRVAHEGAASKMSATWMGIFPVKKLRRRKHTRCSLICRIEFDRESLIFKKNKV